MDNAEQEQVSRSGLGRAQAALRVWSIKEAAAKALGIDLAEAWPRIRVTALADRYSRLEIADGRSLTGVHATLQRHLFTLVTMGGSP